MAAPEASTQAPSDAAPDVYLAGDFGPGTAPGHLAAAAPAEGNAPVAAQTDPSNLNVSVRIFSPGDDGSVTQTNTAAAAGAAPFAGSPDPALPALADPVPGTSAPAGGASPLPVTVGSTGGLPSTWIWNWQWSPGGCGSPAPPSSSSVNGSTWTWSWTWGCAPAPPSVAGIAIPMPAVPAVDAAGIVGGGFGDVAAPPTPAEPVPTAAPSGPAPSARTAEGIAPAGSARWASLAGARARVLSAFASPRSSSARRGAVPHARATASARPAHSPGDRGLGGSGLVAGVAATVGGGAPSSAGTAIGMAAILALFVFFAPQILLPLCAASVRRVRYPSARLERPG